MSTIVLAHGVLGFGDQLPGILSFLPSLHYFNGVADHLRDAGHTVLEPQVDPVGTVKNRGDQLAEKILRQTKPDDRIHILAHSMGGPALHTRKAAPTELLRLATLAQDFA
jgi:hypothetical protein